jgi:hypothetical protein
MDDAQFQYLMTSSIVAPDFSGPLMGGARTLLYYPIPSIGSLAPEAYCAADASPQESQRERSANRRGALLN